MFVDVINVEKKIKKLKMEKMEIGVGEGEKI
jgi:hypothetical protein